MASAGVDAPGMARRLLDTLTKPDSVSGQVAHPSHRHARNHRCARSWWMWFGHASATSTFTSRSLVRRPPARRGPSRASAVARRDPRRRPGSRRGGSRGRGAGAPFASERGHHGADALSALPRDAPDRVMDVGVQRQCGSHDETMMTSSHHDVYASCFPCLSQLLEWLGSAGGRGRQTRSGRASAPTSGPLPLATGRNYIALCATR